MSQPAERVLLLDPQAHGGGLKLLCAAASANLRHHHTLDTYTDSTRMSSVVVDAVELGAQTSELVCAGIAHKACAVCRAALSGLSAQWAAAWPLGAGRVRAPSSGRRSGPSDLFEPYQYATQMTNDSCNERTSRVCPSPCAMSVPLCPFPQSAVCSARGGPCQLSRAVRGAPSRCSGPVIISFFHTCI